MDKALFEEFPPITDQQWQEQVLRDLKGAAPETLEWGTAEGITVKPYYRSGNKPAVVVPVRPVADWLIRQDIAVGSLSEANGTALDALQRGATALAFVCGPSTDLEALLKGVLLEHIHTDWAITDSVLLDGLAEVINKRGLDARLAKGSIQFQPADKVVYFQKYRSLLPGFKLFTILPADADTLGAQIAQQLAEANGIVQSLSQAGVPVAEVLDNVKFDIEVGTDHFFEIARIRARRALWMVVCRQYVPNYNTPAFIHATNKKVSPEKDGYYEMIRQTTQALSAVLGGADSLSLVPHIATPDRTIPFQTRIARNVQLILQHESHLDSTADPASGSWYLEDITAQLAEKAWERFVLLTQNG